MKTKKKVFNCTKAQKNNCPLHKYYELKNVSLENEREKLENKNRKR